MADGKEITDRIAKEENAADVAAFDRYTIEPIKRALKAAKESLTGSEEQNKAAAERMKARDEKNPDSVLTKMNRALGYGSAEGKKSGGKVCRKKAGGKISSASKRGDGIAQRGKTKGRFV